MVETVFSKSTLSDFEVQNPTAKLEKSDIASKERQTEGRLQMQRVAKVPMMSKLGVATTS